MSWEIRSSEEPPQDVAEVVDTRRPVARWVRISVVVAVVAVAGWLLVMRLTSSDITADAPHPGFPNDHTLELDLTVRNSGRDPLGITVTPPHIDGLDFRGVESAGSDSGPALLSAPLPLDGGGTTSFTLVWRIDDCGRAERSADAHATVVLAVGPPIGAKEAVRIPAGQWRSLLPPVCRTHRDAGLPRLAGRQVTSHGGMVAVTITIQNAGGRALRFQSLDKPAGLPGDIAIHLLSTGGNEIPVGAYRPFVLQLPANDCDASVQGPAELVLHFDTVGTTRPETLRVQLADSWPNLLGVCTSPAKP